MFYVKFHILAINISRLISILKLSQYDRTDLARIRDFLELNKNVTITAIRFKFGHIANESDKIKYVNYHLLAMSV